MLFESSSIILPMENDDELLLEFYLWNATYATASKHSFTITRH